MRLPGLLVEGRGLCADRCLVARTLPARSSRQPAQHADQQGNRALLLCCISRGQTCLKAAPSAAPTPLVRATPLVHLGRTDASPPRPSRTIPGPFEARRHQLRPNITWASEGTGAARARRAAPANQKHGAPSLEASRPAGRRAGARLPCHAMPCHAMPRCGPALRSRGRPRARRRRAPARGRGR
jgi:hypothetical protein